MYSTERCLGAPLFSAHCSLRSLWNALLILWAGDRGLPSSPPVELIFLGGGRIGMDPPSSAQSSPKAEPQTKSCGPSLAFGPRCTSVALPWAPGLSSGRASIWSRSHERQDERLKDERRPNSEPFAAMLGRTLRTTMSHPRQGPPELPTNRNKHIDSRKACLPTCGDGDRVGQKQVAGGDPRWRGRTSGPNAREPNRKFERQVAGKACWKHMHNAVKYTSDMFFCMRRDPSFDPSFCMAQAASRPQ